MPMSSSPVTAPSPKETPTDTPSPSNNSSSSTSPSPAEESSPPPASPPPSSPPPASPPPAETTPPPKQSSPPPQAVSPPPKVVLPPPQETTPPAPPTSPPPSPALPKTPPSLPPPVAKTPPSPIPNQPTFSPPPPVAKSPPSGSLSPPPPHAPSHKSPSESSSDATSPTPSNNDSGGLPTATIIGVGAGVGILVFALLILFLCCCCKKKKKEKPIQYYSGLAPRNKGSQYYDNPQTPNWYNTDPHGKVTPPPGGMGQPGGLWAPPPPPPMMSSSEMSPGISGSNGMAPQSPSLGFSKSSFSYDELAAATNGFSQANLLGQGGFGYVHKGVFPNGKVVAVKSLKSGSGQGEREFQAEVEIISRVHHRHLVTLEGYCIAGGQRMLVYEFVPNKTLEFHLHGEDHTLLDWPKRLNIAIGSAKGLAYIHEDCHPRIIHRDIKTANILLDNNFEAMVADFGLAKLSQDNFTHVSTRIMGTFGYLAPEYASSGKLTEKSDVFSFGVMMLELITGRRPVDTTNSYMEDSLVDWARPLCARALENDDYDEIVDPKLENNYNPSEMKCMIACAAASVRHSAKRRPKMSQIVRALEGDVSLEDLNEMRGTPLNSVISTTPGTSTGTSNGNSSEYNTRMYNEDLSKFRKMALGSQAFESGVTSTYGLDPSSSSEFSSNSREMKHSQH